MDNATKAVEFKKELKALLKKYGASIQFEVSDCSDTHGLYNERLEVDFSPHNQPRNYDKPTLLATGWVVEASDL